MSNISFKGFNNNCMTFNAGESAEIGAPAALDENGKIVNAEADEKFLGVICNVRNGITGVQLEGYTELKYTGSAPTLGWDSLSADGNGGVKVDANGVPYRVLKVDTTAKTVGFIL